VQCPLDILGTGYTQPDIWDQAAQQTEAVKSQLAPVQAPSPNNDAAHQQQQSRAVANKRAYSKNVGLLQNENLKLGFS
jgi:hypothetical protein